MEPKTCNLILLLKTPYLIIRANCLFAKIGVSPAASHARKSRNDSNDHDFQHVSSERLEPP